MDAGGGTNGGGTAYTPTWTRLLGTSAEEYAAAVTADGEGGLYVAGETDGSLGGQDYNGGKIDGFVARYDSSGTRQWVKLLGTSDFDNVTSVATDGQGGLYVGGDASGGLGDQTYNGGKIDGYIARYDSSGNRQWVRLIGTSGRDGVESVAPDGEGGLYVVGYAEESLGEQDYNGGSRDGFVARYDSSGDRQWVKLLGTSEYDIADTVTADEQGHLYVAGHTEGDLGEESHGGGKTDVFVARYDSSGTRQWVTLFGSSKRDYSESLTTDGRGGIYVAGSTKGNLGGRDYQGGERDGFVARYDSSGTRQWVRLLGTSGRDEARSVTTDGRGRLYVVGVAEGNLGGQSNNGSADGFVARYDSSGNPQRVSLVGTSKPDGATALSSDERGNLYVAGVTAGDLDGQSNAGRKSDVFVQRWTRASSP
jgi:hypothetical protein